MYRFILSALTILLVTHKSCCSKVKFNLSIDANSYFGNGFSVIDKKTNYPLNNNSSTINFGLKNNDKAEVYIGYGIGYQNYLNNAGDIFLGVMNIGVYLYKHHNIYISNLFGDIDMHMGFGYSYLIYEIEKLKILIDINAFLVTYPTDTFPDPDLVATTNLGLKLRFF